MSAAGGCRRSGDLLLPCLQAGCLPSQAATGKAAGYVRYVALWVRVSRCVTKATSSPSHSPAANALMSWAPIAATRRRPRAPTLAPVLVSRWRRAPALFGALRETPKEATYPGPSSTRHDRRGDPFQALGAQLSLSPSLCVVELCSCVGSTTSPRTPRSCWSATSSPYCTVRPTPLQLNY